ncbi:hypothetical protein C1H46_027775 [Malus baccata]|uniref:Uncharacterized protein n=1 Tax=Malus baccata TaxID=106549 RepID=A0A540LJZ7_MALBA|nr:hypothetical protein C1H46_027775 [Malus baccata]
MNTVERDLSLLVLIEIRKWKLGGGEKQKMTSPPMEDFQLSLWCTSAGSLPPRFASSDLILVTSPTPCRDPTSLRLRLGFEAVDEDVENDGVVWCEVLENALPSGLVGAEAVGEDDVLIVRANDADVESVEDGGADHV